MQERHPPPRMFVRKDLLPRELFSIDTQECDFREFAGEEREPADKSEGSRVPVVAITNHDNTRC